MSVESKWNLFFLCSLRDSESFATWWEPVSILRCGEKKHQGLLWFCLNFYLVGGFHLNRVIFVSGIKMKMFPSLRNWRKSKLTLTVSEGITLRVTYTDSVRSSRSDERFCLYLLRMIKEAKKEKGTDDFLGKVVLKLQVISVCVCIPAILCSPF